MARKFDLISELYERTCFAVTDNPVNWQSFLKTAGRNFRLRFDEQLLIYAQRPDATAVLEIERWNGTFGRWVNRGAKGIAVFEDADRSRQRLIHYFDISDTHESRYSRPVPIWEMRPEFEAEVIETLENTFGAVNDTTSIENVVKESIANAVEDNIADYISDFMSLGAGSDIEYLSADEASTLYLELVRNSVSYMVMARLGLDADKVYSPDDFAGISNFNSQEVLNAVGIATSDIAEMALLPVSRTISTLSKENRIIDEQEQSEYNKDIKDERSQSDERNHIHDGGRLQSSEPETAGADGSDSRQMVADEENLSEGTSQNPVLQSSDERDSEQPLGGGSAESQRTGGNSREADGTESRADGTDESGRYDEVGSTDEQHQELGTGNREESGNIRLEYYDRNHEDKSLPFFGGDDTIREILGTTPHLSASKEEIKDFYERNTDNATRTEYIKGIFNNDYTQLTLSDGRLVGYKTFQNVLHLWEGEYENRTAQSFYDWGVIAQHFEAMRLLGELTDTMKPLPSMDGQLTLIMSNQAEEQKTSAFIFSQEIIDAVLTRGSGVSEGKMRIYEQFEKSLSAKENADFLKNEYGWGGSYPVIIGAGIDEQHDGKGITISKGIGSDKPHITLSWSQVEKRIGDLIRMDRYLNPKEKEKYPEFSVYNDIRKKLIERGVPESEVRFIHEADTDVKKKELFQKTRKGEVRVLLGSTQKMGAGTNVQDRLIALHDVDCPWRPSDLEQRSGRIIRQGNSNPDVDIYRYVTEQTFDAYLYQLVEGKQKFASQIMTSKSPVRSAEDIDETALSYAEIKMLATGNPYIKEKMDLDIQVQKLKLLKSNFLSEKYALEDKIIKYYPQRITALENRIEGLKQDVETAKQHPKPTDDRFVGMEVKGVFYSEKADAGKAIIEACKQMNSPDPIPLGKYRGFETELLFNTAERNYEVRLKGATSRNVPLGDDAYGNIIRLDNGIERFAESLSLAENDLENTKNQLETAKKEVQKPFIQEEELKTKLARLDELNILLNMDKRENEIVGGEPDEGEVPNTRKEKTYER